MKSKGINLTINNQIKLDAATPVPFQYGAGSSIFSYSVKGKRYIPFLGPSDNLPSQLMEARLTSTTQNACINSIVESILGKGLSVKDNENPDKKLIEFLNSINNACDSIDDVVRKCSDGYFSQGNHYVEIVRGVFNGMKYVKVYEHPAIFCRVGKINEETDCPETIIISKSFARNGYIQKSKGEREIPLYYSNKLDKSTNWLKDEKGVERTMLHFKNSINGLDYYGLPPSIAGLRYQVLEGKSAQYNIDNFENNMVLGGMLILKGAMTKEEAEANAKEILISHVGEGKTGRIAVVSSEQGLDDVEWKPYETQREGSFIEFDKRIEEKIIAANGWDRRLAGLDRDAGLSNSDASLSAIYDVKETLLLKPFRKKIIDEVIIPIISIWKEWTGSKIEYDYEFKVELPLSFYGKTNPENYIKVNEARESARLEKDEVNGEKYLADVKTKPKTDVQPEPVK